MRRKIILALLFVISVLYVLGVSFEFYLKTPFVDSTQHFLAGAILALVWLEIAESRNYEKGLMTIIGFVLLASLGWELFELAFWEWLPDYSVLFMLHSPTVEDVLSDMTATFFGGAIIAFWLKAKS